MWIYSELRASYIQINESIEFRSFSLTYQSPVGTEGVILTEHLTSNVIVTSSLFH